MEIERLAARAAISDQIYRYCRAMDRIDEDLGHAVWHPDGTADYGEAFRGTGREFVDFVCEYHRSVDALSHQISNVIIELNGVHAASESYVTATIRYHHGDRALHRVVIGRYLDRWSIREGIWAIDHRLWVHDIEHVSDASESSRPRGAQSASDHSDPSYEFLAGLGVLPGR